MWIFSMLERLRRSAGTVREGRKDRGCGTADKLLFHDENGVLQLAVRPADLICIETAGNYALVRYASREGTSRQPVRCRMHALEGRFRNTRLVRCRRNCIVNMDRVLNVRKGEDGYVLELETGPVRVTRTYENRVLAALGAI